MKTLALCAAFLIAFVGVGPPQASACDDHSVGNTASNTTDAGTTAAPDIRAEVTTADGLPIKTIIDAAQDILLQHDDGNTDDPHDLLDLATSTGEDHGETMHVMRALLPQLTKLV